MQSQDDPAALVRLLERVTNGVFRIGRLPDAVPVSIPPPPGGRLLGSVEHPPRHLGPGGPEITGARFQVYLDAPGDPAEIVTYYERALAREGWTAPDARPGDLGGRGRWHHLYTRNDEGRSATVQVRPADGGINHVTISFEPPRPPYDDQLVPPQRPILFKPPLGGRISGGSGFGTRGIHSTEWTLRTDLPLATAAEHLEQQLAEMGWTRRQGATHDALAWSRWRVPDDDAVESWLLVHQSPVAGQYRVQVRHVTVVDDDSSGEASVMRSTAWFDVSPDPEEPSSGGAGPSDSPDA